jgi:NADPH:quinone reductase-like Zn-dependent oxidoreductase
MIKVESAAFNYNDLWAVWGEPIKVPLPHISGTDIAGTVTDIGSAVTTIEVGDRVVSHANLSCRTCNLCTSGREYDCNGRLVWGFPTGPLWGGFAQFAKLPEANVIKLPSGISFNDSAAIAMVGLTSWHMLVGRAKIVPGQCVLIMGGTSGVGMVGIQIAKLYNCDVIATAGNKDKMDKCFEIGADYVVNHRDPDWYKTVRSITKSQMGGEGVDIVFEHIGQGSLTVEDGGNIGKYRRHNRV